MKDMETLNTIRSASRAAYFLLMRTLRQYADLLDEYVHSEIIHGSNNPQNTVKRFVEEIGRAEAEVVIGSLINATAWDGRISKENAKWAAGIEDAFDEKATNQLRMRTTIHPTHLNAVATAMRESE